MSELEQLPQELIKSLHAEYVSTFPEKVDELNCYVEELASAVSYDEELISRLRFAIHRLAGSSGSYGFQHLHINAKRIEDNIVRHIATKICKQDDYIHLQEEISRLIHDLTVLHQRLSTESTSLNTDFMNEALNSHRDLAIFVISGRSVESKLLVELLEGRGFTVIAFPDIPSAIAISDKVDPAIVILDVKSTNDLVLAEVLKQPRKNNSSGASFILVSERESFDLRLSAAEFGAEAFFATPVNPHNLSSALDVMLKSKGDERCRVLVIQTHGAQENLLQRVASEHNMDCHIVTEHGRVFSALANVKPDIVIIDASSNQGDVAVARMIRMHENYFNIPILFLVEKGNETTHLQALQAGADDCIVIDEGLDDYMKTLRSRILRFRRSNNLIILDSLTGTLNRDAFLDRVSEEISLAARREETICLAMIDVDHFKQVNDANGHVVGDFVLRHISDYLSRRLRRSDIVGRYAGDEFLVFLPDTDLDSAYLVLDIIRKNLVAQTIAVNEIGVTISISLGLVSIQPDSATSVEQLIVEADRLLYEAKVAGRNTLVANAI